MRTLIQIFIFSVAISAHSQDHVSVQHLVANEDYFANGMVKENHLPRLLVEAFSSQSELRPEFKDANCLSAVNIEGIGGFFTRQLFAVTSTCTGNEKRFIVKEPATGLSETNNLLKVSESLLLKSLLWPAQKTNYPTIAAPIKYLSYTSQDVTHFLLVMPEARGKMLCNVIEDFKSDPKIDIPRTYRQLGLEMAHFHNLKTENKENQLLGPSLIHGDMKCLNIFYDEESNNFTLIDNETIAKYLDAPGDRAIDILKLLFGHLITGDDARVTRTLNGLIPKKWYELSAQNFFIGYIEAFPKAQQAQAFRELRALIQAPAPPYYNAALWAQVRSTSIEPIFLLLEKRYQ